MSDLKELLDREARLVDAGPDALDTVLRRRDRKRRNQRIKAGVVGIAVFVAAVWVVTTGLPFDQSRTEGVPGGAGTGPAVTEPAETDSTETGPTWPAVAGWDGLGIPPEGVALSTPAEGELIDQFAELHVGFLFVYADGRVIWLVDGLAGGEGGLRERRITPEGVELVRSGAIRAEDLLPPSVLHGVPADAWADAESRPYAPPRYALCFSRSDGGQEERAVDPSEGIDQLPASAQALLRGKEPRRYEGAGPILADPLPSTECVELATEEVRRLVGVLIDAGVETNRWGELFVRDEGGAPVMIFLEPLFPDGLWHYMGG